MAAVLPALDEEQAIGGVLAGLSVHGLEQVLVADNGSRDRTAEVARGHGATVVAAPRRGYGHACLAALQHLADGVDTVVFLDADGADDPEDLPRVLEPLLRGEADLVIGSRLRGDCRPGALLLHARLGNWLAARLMARWYGLNLTDNGPFRAIRRDCLERLGMEGSRYRWTTEMVVKAARSGMRVTEVPVSYRRRPGRSKVSGTLAGSLGAAWGILFTLWAYRRWPPAPAR